MTDDAPNRADSADATAAGTPAQDPNEDAAPPGGLKHKIKAMAKDRLPEGSRGRAVALAGLASYRETVEYGRRLRTTWSAPGVRETRAPSYRTWLQQHKSTPAQLRAQREYADKVENPARLLAVVLPGPGRADDSLASVRAQTWPHQVATTCSTVEAANVVAGESDADLVVLLRAGDRLEPDCFYHLATTVRQDPLVDLVSWDDDLRDAKGHRGDPRFKPSWSPEMLLGGNYLGHSFAVRRSRFVAAGGLRPDVEPAADWDLLLRLDLTADRTAHVARLLGSLPSRDPVPERIAVQVVRDHLERVGLPATAESAGGGRVRLRWTAPATRYASVAAAAAAADSPAAPASPAAASAEWPHVTVIIPTRHNRDMLSRCLPSLARTAYPSFDVVIVDNGGRTADNEAWYAGNSAGLDLDILWWDETPFNYSRVNNAAAAKARGEVLVFLNDDTEANDPEWMRELVGWASVPEIGTAGLRLIDGSGKIQHYGVYLGVGGFADHTFQGMRPGADSIFGSTDLYRDTLAVTGACVAVRRELFNEMGGLDERFQLTGSDVALGLEATLRGYRNVCSPFAGIRHLESATRGTNVPLPDFFASYWRYNSWLLGGDPYYNPNLSLGSRTPALRSAHEPTVRQRISVPLGRRFEAFRQRNDAAEARMLAQQCQALPADVQAVSDLHARNAGAMDVKTVNWFIPDIDSPFYGGINTALRIADHMARFNGVTNQFVVLGSPPDYFARSALAAAFPSLADSEIVFFDGQREGLADAPEADAAIATLWTTAYAVAHAANQKRKFYLIQDFEPMFYPASTLYALAEESYRLGLYGLCNTDNMRQIYAGDYGGSGMSFMPAVDQSVFHARTRKPRDPDDIVTVFVYARPGHWRNCWEMASLALEELKRRLGDRVRIVTAGAWATGEGADHDIRHLGLLDYRATGELYRQCDVGLALTVSKHPSYLPLELMACGVPLVAFDNPWGHWILRDGENSLLAKRTADSLTDRLERLCTDFDLRQRMSAAGLADIAAGHASWDGALSGIHPYLCDPNSGTR